MEYHRFQKIIPAAVALVVLAILATPAMAVGVWTWVPGDPNYNGAAVIHPGTIGLPDPADFIGTGSGYPAGFGDSGDTHPSLHWDDTYVGGIGNSNTNGDNWDGLWTQINAGNNEVGWWDLGGSFQKVVVSTSQDHGAYLPEALEYRIFGCMVAYDSTSCGPQATMTDVYLDGWRGFNAAEDADGNGWCSDDMTAVVDLGGNYPYVMLKAWDQTGSLNEPEVDAMGGIKEFVSIPEFPTVAVPAALLIGIFLAAIWLRRRNT